MFVRVCDHVSELTQAVSDVLKREVPISWREQHRQLKIRNIDIRPVLNGWVAKVGCQELVFDSVDGLVAHLQSYIDDPHGMEKETVEGAVNCHLMGDGAAQADMAQTTSQTIAGNIIDRIADNAGLPRDFMQGHPVGPSLGEDRAAIDAGCDQACEMDEPPEGRRV
jgi:hypothetical protein